MAESGGLENRCVREGTVGSNPTPSAKWPVSATPSAATPYAVFLTTFVLINRCF